MSKFANAKDKEDTQASYPATYTANKSKPQYQVTKQGSIIVKMKYSRNFIYLWRFQQQNEANKDAPINPKENINFPISYENFGNFLDFIDNVSSNPVLELEEQTVKGNLILKLTGLSQKKQIHFELQQQSKDGEQKLNLFLNIPQAKLVNEQMKQGLPIVTGWYIPNKFVTEIQNQKTQSLAQNNE